MFLVVYLTLPAVLLVASIYFIVRHKETFLSSKWTSWIAVLIVPSYPFAVTMALQMLERDGGDAMLTAIVSSLLYYPLALFLLVIFTVHSNNKLLGSIACTLCALPIFYVVYGSVNGLGAS